MNLRQAKCLDAVARLGSFRAAAAELVLSQPAVSQHVALLEHDLGLQLVSRTPRGALLTSEGVALLPRIRAFIAAEVSAIAEAGALRKRLGGLVKVSSVSLSLSEFLAPVIASFLRHYPEFQIEVREASAETVARRVREGTDDLGVFGLMGRHIGDMPGMVQHPVGVSELRLAAPLGHSFLTDQDIARERLARQPLIAFHRGWAIREAFDDYFAGLLPNVVCEVFEVGAARYLIGAGAGLSLLPVPAEDGLEGPALAYRMLEPPPPVLTRVVAEPERAERPLAAQAFLEELFSTVDEPVDKAVSISPDRASRTA